MVSNVHKQNTRNSAFAISQRSRCSSCIARDVGLLNATPPLDKSSSIDLDDPRQFLPFSEDKNSLPIYINMMTPVLVLLSLGLCMANAESPLKVTVSWNGFHNEGADITVTCDFQPAYASSSDSLVSLTLSWKGQDMNFTDIATATALNPEELTTAEDFEGTATGMVHASGNASYLKIRYPSVPFPSPDLEEFQCEATSINRFGHCVKVVQKTNISLDGSDIDMPWAIKKMLDMKNDLDNANRQIEECASRLTGMLTAALKKDAGSDLVWVSKVHKTSFYAVHKKQDKCSSLNGYLAEINDEEEFYFIEENLQTHGLPSGKVFLLTGASYSSLQGPFKFATNPEDTVYTGHWGSGQPHRNNMDYNWLLLQYRGQNLAMADGTTHGHRLVYLCEIPLWKLSERDGNESM